MIDRNRGRIMYGEALRGLTGGTAKGESATFRGEDRYGGRCWQEYVVWLMGGNSFTFVKCRKSEESDEDEISNSEWMDGWIGNRWEGSQIGLVPTNAASERKIGG